MENNLGNISGAFLTLREAARRVLKEKPMTMNHDGDLCQVKFGTDTIIGDNGPHASYIGDMIDGIPAGSGIIMYFNQATYTGEVANSMPHGVGTMTNAVNNAQTIRGEWRNGSKCYSLL